MKEPLHPLSVVARCVGGREILASILGVTLAALGNWKARGVPIQRCVAIERLAKGAVTRRDLRPDDWREIWPELEEVETLRAQVAQLMERLRKYEPDVTPAQAPQALDAINCEAREAAHV